MRKHKNKKQNPIGGRRVIELIEKGMYLVDGVPCETADMPVEEAKKNTIAYGILQAHNHSGNPDKLQVKFDALISHDITYVGIIQQARASGMKKFPLPYALTNCHNSLCAVGGTINEDDHVFGLSAAKKYGGICEVALSYTISPVHTEEYFVKLAKELDKHGNIYVLDEPTTGLHASDIKNIMQLLDGFVERRNTVIVIEHNLDVMKQADYLIDVGPDGGTAGGEIVFTGTPQEMIEGGKTITADYLRRSLN